jgi:hypothetical protein
MKFPATPSYFELFPAHDGTMLATDGEIILRHVKHVAGRKETLGWYHNADDSQHYTALEGKLEHVRDLVIYRGRQFKRAARIPTNSGRAILHPHNEDAAMVI